MFDKEKFLIPKAKFRVKPMMHAYSPQDDPKALADILKLHGYGGAVINPSFNEQDFATDKAIDDFKAAIDCLRDKELEYWVYDEKGYISGHANGVTLKDHPELEGKGLFMIRRIAFEPKHSTFTIDDETDKIIWVAKYPLDTSNFAKPLVRYSEMIAVPFSDTHVECDLNENEALFIFCQKSAFEGSHLTHNTANRKRYINMMDEKAIQRYIEVSYQKLYDRHPEIFEKCEAVFTDEPSLQVGYHTADETWPYALVPYTHNLFEEYEKEYGCSLLPYLPLLFENGIGAAPVRINFYRLVAKLIAKAFSGQLAKWCREHSSVFSGHYLGEETLYSHTILYGDLIPVVMEADYPGIDILKCVPETYNCNTAKYVQMVARKKNTNGMMVEFCPFYERPRFMEDPWNNMSGIVGLLALDGCRRFNSYFRADLNEYDERFPKGCKGVSTDTIEESRRFNEYVGRVGYMLENTKNDTRIFVYRPIEDAQSKFIPTISAALPSAARETDARVSQLVHGRLYANGVDFQYVDIDDLEEAVNSIEDGKATVSGCDMKLLLVPGVDLIDTRAKKAMVELKNAGIKVLFCNKVATLGTQTEDIDLTEHFKAATGDEIMEQVNKLEDDFTACALGVKLHTARYCLGEKEMYFVVNNTRGVDAELTLNHKARLTATLYNPVDGSSQGLSVGERYAVPSFRGVFIVFD